MPILTRHKDRRAGIRRKDKKTDAEIPKASLWDKFGMTVARNHRYFTF
jgi:hypothetical protein